MPDYAVIVHRHGQDSDIALQVTGTKSEAKDYANQLAAESFPGHSTKWNNDALLLREGEEVVGCISIEKWEAPAG